MAGFHRAHKAMARQTKAERRAAVNHLKKTVGGMRREFALDLAGAHRAWFGPSPAERRAQAEAERRAKAEAEAEHRAKEAAERDRMAALAMAKEEAVRHHAAPATQRRGGAPGKKERLKSLSFLVIQTDDPSTTRGAEKRCTWTALAGKWRKLPVLSAAATAKTPLGSCPGSPPAASAAGEGRCRCRRLTGAAPTAGAPGPSRPSPAPFAAAPAMSR